MNDNIITLTRGQLAELRGNGQTYAGRDIPGMVRILRQSSGYGPLPGATNQIALTDADLNDIEARQATVTDTLGQVTWTITVEPA